MAGVVEVCYHLVVSMTKLDLVTALRATHRVGPEPPLELAAGLRGLDHVPPKRGIIPLVEVEQLLR